MLNASYIAAICLFCLLLLNFPAKKDAMFKPSSHAFRFGNHYGDDPYFFGVVNANQGLCGGMTLTALDYYNAGKDVSRLNIPAKGTTLYKHIKKRQIDSLSPPFGIIRNYIFTAYPFSLYSHSLNCIDDFEKLQPLTLINLHSYSPMDMPHNHQVLAYDVIREEDSVRVMIYDCNYPCDDSVYIELKDETITHSKEGEIRGFYMTWFTKKFILGS